MGPARHWVVVPKGSAFRACERWPEGAGGSRCLCRHQAANQPWRNHPAAALLLLPSHLPEARSFTSPLAVSYWPDPTAGGCAGIAGPVPHHLCPHPPQLCVGEPWLCTCCMQSRRWQRCCTSGQQRRLARGGWAPSQCWLGPSTAMRPPPCARPTNPTNPCSWASCDQAKAPHQLLFLLLCPSPFLQRLWATMR